MHLTVSTNNENTSLNNPTLYSITNEIDFLSLIILKILTSKRNQIFHWQFFPTIHGSKQTSKRDHSKQQGK